MMIMTTIIMNMIIIAMIIVLIMIVIMMRIIMIMTVIMVTIMIRTVQNHDHTGQHDQHDPYHDHDHNRKTGSGGRIGRAQASRAGDWDSILGGVKP